MTKPYFIIFIIILIIIHSFIPIIYRLSKGISALGNSSIEIYFTIITTIFNIAIFIISMIFVEIGGNDYNRKLYFLKCLSSMINPDRLRVQILPIRYVPLINYFCPKNLKTWFYIRLLALDIGKRYMKRIELYASSFLFIYGLFLGILLLGLFDFLKILSIDKYPLLYYMGFAQSGITFIVIYRMMYLGAKVNEYFKIHRSEISLIKFKILDVINNFQKWKKMNAYFDPYLEKTKDFYYYCAMYYKLKSEEDINDDKNNGFKIPNPSYEEEFLEYLKNLTEEYSNLIEELELQEEINSIKLLGFTLNQELVSLFNSAFIGLGISLIQKFLQTNS